MTDEGVLGPERIKHLEFIQAVIARLGTSSFLIKGWALTVGAAFFGVLAGRLSTAIALAALVPLLAFWYLDAYFLWQERLFRHLYDEVRMRDSAVAPMSMSTAQYTGRVTLRAAVFSRTLIFFYGVLVVVDVALVVAAAVA